MKTHTTDYKIKIMNYNITAKNTRLIVNDGEMAVDVNKTDLAQLLAAAPGMFNALREIEALAREIKRSSAANAIVSKCIDAIKALDQ